MNEEHEAATGKTTLLNLDNNPPKLRKLTVVLLGLIALLLLATVVVQVFDLRIKPSEPGSNVVVIVQSPTPLPIRDMENYWMNRTDRLSPAEQGKLRQQSQVYNLAYIAGDTIQYYKTSISSKNPAWRRAEDLPHLYVAGASSGIGVFVRVYHFLRVYNKYLNAYQPFVSYRDPTHVYMVLPDNTVWVIDITKVDESIFVSEEKVESDSGIELPVNPNLSL